MKISNKTRWSTDDLRAIISAALKSRGVPSTGLVVEVVVSKKRVTGRALLGKMREGFRGSILKGTAVMSKEMNYGKWMLMRIPNPLGVGRVRLPEGAKPIAPYSDLREMFAAVVEHEVAHLQGLRHGDMSDKLRWCKQETPWLGELQLRAEEKPVECKAAAFDDKEAHAKRMLAKAATRLKRATTLAKKWERRVAYYERKKS